MNEELTHLGRVREPRTIELNPNQSLGRGRATLAHEGQHVQDMRAGLPSEPTRSQRLLAEMRAAHTEAEYARLNGLKDVRAFNNPRNPGVLSLQIQRDYAKQLVGITAREATEAVRAFAANKVLW